MAHVLDLIVLPGEEHQLPPVIELSDIAGAVNQLRIRLVQGVLHKHLVGSLKVAVIPQGQAGAPQTDLSRLAGGGGTVLLRQEEKPRVGEGPADGQHLVVGKFPVHLVPAGHARSLGGAVEVNKPGVGQGRAPELELLDRKDLASESHRVKVLRDMLVQHLEAGDHGQGGHHPADRVDFVLVEVLHQLDRKGKQLLGNQIGGGAAPDGGVQLLEAGVEIEGSLIAENGVLRDVQDLVQPLDIVQYRPMAGGYALGHAGGTGGKDDVNGICVQGVPPDPDQRVLVDRRCGQLVVRQDMSSLGSQGLGLLPGLFITEDEAGLQLLKNQLHTEGGHLPVDGYIEAPGVHHAKKACNHLGVPLHKYHHRLACRAQFQQAGPDGPGLRMDLPEGQPLRAVGESQLLRYSPGGGVQVFQNICLHQAASISPPTCPPPALSAISSPPSSGWGRSSKGGSTHTSAGGSSPD